MSKIGKKIILIPEGVKVEVNGTVIKVTGAKGVLEQDISNHVKVEIKDNEITITPNVSGKQGSAFWGLYRSLIKNMITGVSEGFEKILELRGVGYRAVGSGQKITLNLGYSHQIEFVSPLGVTMNVEDQTKIKITGQDKALVGQVASNIRKLRKPEPYKGKGVRYQDEVVKLKAGKTGAA